MNTSSLFYKAHYLPNYLLRLISCTATILLLGACSFSNPKSIKSNRLASGTPEKFPQWNINQLEGEPPLYRITTNLVDNSKNPTYATSFTECGLGRTASGLATTRQLLVGLKEISLEKDVRFMDQDQRVFFSLFGGRLDDHRLKLVNFAIREESCVRDITLWSENFAEGSVLAELINADQAKLLEVYKSLTSLN